MKTSCLRLAVFAAGLFVATLASAQATWSDWSALAHPEWPGKVYADAGSSGSNGGTLTATGGGIYGDTAGNYYYTLFASPSLTLTPATVVSGLQSIELFIGETWNVGYGPVGLTLYYKVGGVTYSSAAPVPVTSGASVDLAYTWSVPAGVTEFWFEWSLVPHSTFSELVITQS